MVIMCSDALKGFLHHTGDECMCIHPCILLVAAIQHETCLVLNCERGCG